MTRAVVDASVVVKWFVPEDLWEKATVLLDGKVDLWAPDLLVPEVGNVLWKLVHRKRMTFAVARETVRDFSALPVEIVPSASLLEPGLEIATTLGRAIYDCLYLALAVGMDCPLVTADRRFAHAARNLFPSNVLWLGDLAG